MDIHVTVLSAKHSPIPELLVEDRNLDDAYGAVFTNYSPTCKPGTHAHSLLTHLLRFSGDNVGGVLAKNLVTQIHTHTFKTCLGEHRRYPVHCDFFVDLTWRVARHPELILSYVPADQFLRQLTCTSTDSSVQLGLFPQTVQTSPLDFHPEDISLRNKLRQACSACPTSRVYFYELA